MTQTIRYSIGGNASTREPVVAKVNSKATLEGCIDIPGTADVFSASVNKICSQTGVEKYEVLGPDLFSSSILAFTGLDSEITFVLDPSQINPTTGAIHGELYGLKFIATETGAPNHKYVADVIVDISDRIEG